MTKNAKTKKTKAWLVVDDVNSQAEVVFSNSKLDARRIGAGRLNTELEYVSISRHQEFDSFFEKGFVPPITLIKAGFEISCHECERMIVNDADEDDEERISVDKAIESGQHVFCNNECCAEFQHKVKDRNRLFEEFKTKVQSARPDLTFTEFTGGWPWITMTGKFVFDGCQFGGSVRDQEGTGKIEWYIANGDKQKWDEYENLRNSENFTSEIK